MLKRRTIIDYYLFSSIMEARWGGKVEITKKTNNADQVSYRNMNFFKYC